VPHIFGGTTDELPSFRGPGQKSPFLSFRFELNNTTHYHNLGPCVGSCWIHLWGNNSGNTSNCSLKFSRQSARQNWLSRSCQFANWPCCGLNRAMFVSSLSFSLAFSASLYKNNTLEVPASSRKKKSLRHYWFFWPLMLLLQSSHLVSATTLTPPTPPCTCCIYQTWWVFSVGLRLDTNILSEKGNFQHKEVRVSPQQGFLHQSKLLKRNK